SETSQSRHQGKPRRSTRILCGDNTEMALETGGSLNRATASEDPASRRTWLVSMTSFIFIVLQSACTAVIAVSGVRVAIGLSALAATFGIHAPAHGFHQDAIRIPMMIAATLGSL